MTNANPHMNGCPRHPEDHIGDVIHKARALRGVPALTAATAAGLTVTELMEFERHGRCPRTPDYERLGTALGLSGVKLARMASGVVTPEVPLPRSVRMECITTEQHGNAANAYVVWAVDCGRAVIIDAGWNAAPLIGLLQARALEPRAVLLTHTHQDHTGGLDELVRAFPELPVYRPRPAEPAGDGSAHGAWPLKVGLLTLHARAVPGHTADSTMYLVQGPDETEPALAFVGDTMFCCSLGRGFYSWPMAWQSAREQILSLPPETVICPGHGPLTTVRFELENNPFF